MEQYIANLIQWLFTQKSMGGLGIREGLIATSAASAVLWTGALIVTQLAVNDRDDDEKNDSPSLSWALKQGQSSPILRRIGTPEDIDTLTALSLLGFGVFAPIFPLFAQGLWLTGFAVLLLLFYARLTLLSARAIPLIRRTMALFKSDEKLSAYLRTLLRYHHGNVIQYATIVLIAIRPTPQLILLFSITWSFFGYQMVLGRYIGIRRPFDLHVIGSEGSSIAQRSR